MGRCAVWAACLAGLCTAAPLQGGGLRRLGAFQRWRRPARAPVSVSAAAAAASALKAEYAQHFDANVILPDAVAARLVWTSQALLCLVAYAAAAGYGGLAASTLVLHGTSVRHWRKPRYGSLARCADLAAVAANVFYATVLACTRAKSRAWTLAWLLGVAGIAGVFAANEAVFALRLRAPAHKRDAGDARPRGARTAAAWAAAPGTPQRGRVYRRNAMIHGGCMHVLASALGCAMVSKGLRPR
ncbi:hypothetical protein M885DRAFT_585327 [Pelagophyceae sp. CCMP2097]|nr:hypothetical protein M885DRAFT_585327 [Pelagophyceae sp. CCMP2097]